MTRNELRVRVICGDRVAGLTKERVRPFILRVERLILSFSYCKRESADGCKHYRVAFCTLSTKRCTFALYYIISIFYIDFLTALRFLYSFNHNLIIYKLYNICVCVIVYERENKKMALRACASGRVLRGVGIQA